MNVLAWLQTRRTSREKVDCKQSRDEHLIRKSLSSFKSEGRSITDPVEVADRFCKYFSNIGPNLASAIPTVNTSFRSFLDNNNNTPITLKPTNSNELGNICSKFNSGKAAGYDNIPLHVVKHSFHLISAPLVDTINPSLLKGIFPDKLKIA